MGRFSVPARQFFTILLLAFVSCLFFTGCQTGPGVTTSQSGGTTLASEASAPHQYSQLVELHWVEASVNSRLVRAQGTSDVLAQQDFLGPSLRPLLQEQGQDTALASRTRFGGVVPSVLIGRDPGRDSTLEISWTFPDHDSDRPALLQVAGSPPVTLSSNTVNIRYEMQELSYKIFINGEFVEEREFPIGAGVVQIPAFTSFVSGPHTITTLATGSPDDASISGTWNYNQKSLVFEQESHDFELDSDEPIEIVNSFGWDNGSPAINPSWRLILGGTNGFVKEGTGTEVQATWDPRNLVLTQSLEEMSLSLIGRAEGYPGTEYITGADGSVPSSKTGLQIINEQVTQDVPFGEPDALAELVADIVIIDGEDITGDVSWAVDIVDSEGNTVVENVNEGTGYDVTAQWDGANVENPELHLFRITAHICDGGPIMSRVLDAVRGQESCNILAGPVTVDAALSFIPKLEIKEGRQTLATSKDDPTDLSEAGVSRLGRIQELRTWEIRLSGLKVDGQPPSAIMVSIDSSGSKDDIELRHIESGVQGEVYQTYVTSTDPILLKQPDQSYVYNEIDGIQDKPLGLMEVDENDLSSFSTAIENISLALKLPNYPYAAQPKRLGILEYLTRAEPDNSSRSIAPGRAIGDRQNFPKFGFEDVTFFFEDANSQFINLTTELKATVKTQNKAAFVYTLVHGSPNGGLQLPQIGSDGTWTRTEFLPSSLQDDDVTGLRTLILDSCAALATNDYNNQIVDSAKPLSERPKGGLSWREHTRVAGQGPVLLGYNTTIWRRTAQKSRNNYFPELSRLKREGVDDSLVQQYAWLSANRKNGDQGHFACALDNDFYYYMSYDTGPKRDNIYGRQLNVKFVKVPISSIDSVQVDSFSQYTDGVPNGAAEFTIPGVE